MPEPHDDLRLVLKQLERWVETGAELDHRWTVDRLSASGTGPAAADALAARVIRNKTNLGFAKAITS